MTYWNSDPSSLAPETSSLSTIWNCFPTTADPVQWSPRSWGGQLTDQGLSEDQWLVSHTGSGPKPTHLFLPKPPLPLPTAWVVGGGGGRGRWVFGSTAGGFLCWFSRSWPKFCLRLVQLLWPAGPAWFRTLLISFTKPHSKCNIAKVSEWIKWWRKKHCVYQKSFILRLLLVLWRVLWKSPYRVSTI